MVFFVLFKMFGKIFNSFGQYSDLYFRRTGVAFVSCVSKDVFQVLTL